MPSWLPPVPTKVDMLWIAIMIGITGYSVAKDKSRKQMFGTLALATAGPLIGYHLGKPTIIANPRPPRIIRCRVVRGRL